MIEKTGVDKTPASDENSLAPNVKLPSCLRLLVINGPNINMLGIREPEKYGKNTYTQLCELILDHAEKRGVVCEIFQSNHEGAIVDKIQAAYRAFSGIIINPAAYTHTSIAIADALAAVDIPYVEVHLTDTSKREDFRRVSFVSAHAAASIVGHGFEGYIEAADFLIELLR